MISFLSKIITLDKLNVIGIIKKEDSETYNVLSVKKKGDKIDIITKASYATFEELKQNIDTKLPILLNIDGKGVLNKQINFNNEADVTWHKNIDFGTIYYTSVKSTDSSFISFCRKNIVEEYKAKFQSNGLSIIDVYIGAFLASLLQGSINKKTIVSNELALEFEDDLLAGFAKSEEKQQYTIGKETISNAILPLYGILLHFFLKQKEVSKTESETHVAEEIIYKKAFNVFGISMLVGFLVALLSSYFLIQYYGAENAELSLKNVYSNQSYQKILELEKQKENKLKILNESGFLTSKFLSFYGYQIIKTIPDEIALKSLKIAPLYEEIKVTKKVDFEAKTIIIEGQTLNESSLNSWMEKVKTMDWVKNFEIMSIKKDKKGITQFQLKIIINDV